MGSCQREVWNQDLYLIPRVFSFSNEKTLGKVSMGLTDKTAKTLVDSRKNWKFLTVSRKKGKKELITVKEIVP